MDREQEYPIEVTHDFEEIYLFDPKEVLYKDKKTGIIVDEYGYLVYIDDEEIPY